MPDAVNINARAGQLADASDLVDVPKLITAYYEDRPDPHSPEQRVIFGRSGHRGPSFDRSFNECHILAITQAICAYRQQKKFDGPPFLGIDMHALSFSRRQENGFRQSLNSPDDDAQA